VESTSAAHSHATAVETTTTATVETTTTATVEATTTATVETTTTTAVAATAATTTTGLSLGYKQATNQYSGRQYSHRSFQHVFTYVKRLISLGSNGRLAISGPLRTAPLSFLEIGERAAGTIKLPFRTLKIILCEPFSANDTRA
jgi:hypothetical protein